MDTCNIESIEKHEEKIYNIRLFMKIIRTIWKLVVMIPWPVSITTSSIGWQYCTTKSGGFYFRIYGDFVFVCESN